MRLLVVTQGQWGMRIANYVRQTAPSDWTITLWEAPTALPAVMDDPAEFLPASLPDTDLLLILTESPGLTDLSPDIARLAGAQAAIVGADRRSWAPPGLLRQVEQRLKDQGIGSAIPAPLCTLAPHSAAHPLINDFAQRYGCPEISCTIDEGNIVACEVTREAPCGNTRYVVDNLAGVPADQAVMSAGMLHHYFPCLAGMDGDTAHSEHTMLHIAAGMAQEAVSRAIDKQETGVKH